MMFDSWKVETFIELVYFDVKHWIIGKIKEVLSYNNQIFYDGFGHCRTRTGILLDTFREVLEKL